MAINVNNTPDSFSGENPRQQGARNGAVIKKLSKGGKPVAGRQKKLGAINVNFKKLVENSYEGITLFDKDLKITYRSNSAKRITGWNINDRKKNTIIQLTHPDDMQDVQTALTDVLKKPGKSVTCSFRSLHFKGHYLGWSVFLLIF